MLSQLVILVSAVPQVQCEISLPAWCLSNFDGSIEMKNNAKSRIWILRRRGEDTERVVVSESESCRHHGSYLLKKPAVVSRKLYKNNVEKLNSINIKYENGCLIDIEWNEYGRNSIYYSDYIFYGVRIFYEGDYHQLHEVAALR